MSIEIGPFKIIDHQNDSYCIKVTEQLVADDAVLLRQAVNDCISTSYDVIYIDLKDVLKVDLSGINEVINAHYAFKNVSKQLILLYKRNSEIEKWVGTTGLDKFVATAIVPAI